jgi:2-keto-3-deoxy-L-rhamnonate aldolase RhmA
VWIQVAAACKSAGIAWGLPVPSPERAAAVRAQGAQFINLGGDFGYCMKGLETNAAELDSAFGKSASVEEGSASKAY